MKLTKLFYFKKARAIMYLLPVYRKLKSITQWKIHMSKLRKPR